MDGNFQRSGRALLVALLVAVSNARAQTTVECFDDDTREQIRALLLSAIDDGLKNHTVKLFDNWLKDPTNQPERAIAGVKPAIRAYVRARAAARNWDPPNC